ncbi:hypothetical protein BJ170DRAFT_54833 [Xylariales sp. AK1849]|nr:hypothetical protein BJ170DRAFT_54833 [Xylariales sp. AK1849]
MSSTASFRTTANASQPSLTAPTLPPYPELPKDIELVSSTSRESTASLDGALQSPSSSQAGPATHASTFRPTLQLQIQTAGKPLLSFPTPVKAVPIPVFTLTPDGDLHRQLYLSVRPSRGSGSCFLVRGDDEAETPLTTTAYRFGPGKPPTVKLVSPANHEREEEFEITSIKTFSRAQGMKTGLGTFEWRYASSKERAAESGDRLLLLERVVVTGDGNPRRERRAKVAQLVRNEAYRTPGTSKSTAGNGGRLTMDLSGFDEKERERAQLLVVTTAILMLKKEVDRRRMHQTIAIGAAASGGS